MSRQTERGLNFIRMIKDRVKICTRGWERNLGIVFNFYIKAIKKLQNVYQLSRAFNKDISLGTLFNFQGKRLSFNLFSPCQKPHYLALVLAFGSESDVYCPKNSNLREKPITSQLLKPPFLLNYLSTKSRKTYLLLTWIISFVLCLTKIQVLMKPTLLLPSIPVLGGPVADI